jgi:hypothetical protein
MERLWCWRCKCEMPMLDEVEYAEALTLYGEGIRATKEFRERWQIPLLDTLREAQFRPLLDTYERMTGMRESNPAAIMHHRIALYGPPCRRCQKPLRTPQAKLCGSCIARVDSE